MNQVLVGLTHKEHFLWEHFYHEQSKFIDFKEAILKTKGSVEHTGFAFSGEYLYQYRMKKITFGSQILHQMMTEFVSQK